MKTCIFTCMVDFISLRMLPLLLLAGMVACKSNSSAVSESDQAEEPKVLTVVLEFVKGPDITKDTISIYNTVISPGVIKQRKTEEDSTGIYLVQFKNKRGDIYKKIFLDDPLRQGVEYAAEGDTLQTAKIEKSVAAVPLRVNYKPEISLLELYLNTYEGLESIAEFNLD